MAENKLLNQAQTFFGKLNTVQRILLVGIPSVVIIGLVVLLMTSAKKPMELLYNNLEQREAAKIVEYLKAQQIDYELQDNGTTIAVDKEKVLDTRVMLAAEGIPESGTIGYELFDKTNLGMSEFVQKLNFRRALEGELSKTISSIDEVRKARVHLVIPENALFEKDQKKPTASVTIHQKQGKNLSQKTIVGIQTLIAKSIEGMLPEDVSVIDHKGKLLSESPIDNNSVAGLTSQQLDQQKKVEDYLTNKVQTLLDGVIGADNSNVRVNTEIDFTRIEQTKTDYDPDRQVVRSEQQIAESNKSTDSLSYPAVNMDKQESNSIQNYEISQSYEHIIHSVGNIKRLSVAAMINGTTKIIDSNGIKKLVYVPKTEQEIQQITEIIKNALGFDPNRNDQISVINVPFDTMIDDESVERLNPPAWWLLPENQRLLILLGAIIIAIIMMYRMLQSKQLKERIRIAMELPHKVDIKDEEEEEVEDERLEDLEIDHSDLLLMPAELPDQLLLESEKKEEDLEEPQALPDAQPYDKRALAERAKAKLEDTRMPEMTEEGMMKLEMRNQVEEYLDDRTEDAVRLIRMFISQDAEEKQVKF